MAVNALVVSCIWLFATLWSLGQEDPLEKEMANPLHYSYLENSMDREAWRAAVRGVARVRHDWALTHSKPQCNGIWRKILWKVIRVRWGCEGEIFLWDSCPCKKGYRKELTLSFTEESSHQWTRKWAPSRHRICWHLNLGLSELWEKRPVVYKPCSAWHFVIAAQNNSDTN